ncbi:MAG: dihydropteroate synthase [Myxococcota bacterium]
MEQATVFPPGRVTIVGVLNLTPDSFSDGGRFIDRVGVDVRAAVDAGAALAAAGAHVVDVGGESTRPGADEISIEEEIDRTQRVVEALAKELAVPISIDTRRGEVAGAAIDAGASVVNDVSGLGHDPRLAELAAGRGATLILGHMRGGPATMQRDISFVDVVAEVTRELAESVACAEAAGVPREQLCVDPGIGFGKRLPHNLALLSRVGELRESLGLPVLVGPSRKSFLGELTGDPVGERDTATHAACAIAVFAGADAVRVHDVDGARRAAEVAIALREAAAESSR